MIQRGLIGLLAAAFVFWLGYRLGSERTAQAFAGNRVFELRTYTANEGKTADMHARFRNHTAKLFEKHGMTNVGYWSPLDSPQSQNTLIYLLAFPDREAAKKSWDAFRTDPDWRKAQQESEVNGRLVSKVESIYMEPTDYSPMK